MPRVHGRLAHTRSPRTRSAFAERSTGGFFVDFEVNRDAAARYGLQVQDINEVIMTAVGGMAISQTVEGRERYPINVRYADGADVMKRIAAPMVGGLVTSFLLELTIYPAIFAVWKSRGLPKDGPTTLTTTPQGEPS